ncbi:hypothetical protein RJG79_04590 [Mycoplasmatota bacterium WC44]
MDFILNNLSLLLFIVIIGILINFILTNLIKLIPDFKNEKINLIVTVLVVMLIVYLYSIFTGDSIPTAIKDIMLK